MVRVEKISTTTAFQALAPRWNVLLERSSANTLSLTYEWLSTWWEVFGKDRELYILLVWEGEELIGIAPLLKRTVQHYGLLPFRRLEFLASGEDESDEICSDYLDFILLNGRETTALAAILRYLQEDSDWDEILLTALLEESASFSLLAELCNRSGVRLQKIKEDLSIYLPLTGSWEEISGNVSNHLRKKLKQDRRVFAGLGGDLRIIETFDDYDEGLKLLVDLHQQRWNLRGLPGVFTSDKFLHFHRRFAEKTMPQGWVKIFIAAAQGKPIAALYNFNYNKRTYYYQSGTLPSGSGLQSPGMLVQGFAIEDAICRGCQEFDFLKGEPNSYKFKWLPQTRSLLQVRLSQGKTKETIYSTTAKVIDGLRSLKRGIKNSATLANRINGL